MYMSSKFAYKIEDNLGVISTSKTGWTKGLTFNWEEAIRLKRLMEQIG